MRGSTPILALALTVATTPVAAARAPDQRAIGQVTAECTAEQDRGHVVALLATLPGSPAEKRAARRLEAQFAACSGGQYRLTAGRAGSGLYNGRADLAAAMVAARGPEALPKPGAEVWYAKAAAAAGQGGFDPVLLGFQEFGACVAAAAPQGAARLVRADAGSDEERAAMAALRPVVAEPVYHALDAGA